MTNSVVDTVDKGVSVTEVENSVVSVICHEVVDELEVMALKKDVFEMKIFHHNTRTIHERNLRRKKVCTAKYNYKCIGSLYTNTTVIMFEATEMFAKIFFFQTHCFVAAIKLFVIMTHCD